MEFSQIYSPMKVYDFDNYGHKLMINLPSFIP